VIRRGEDPVFLVLNPRPFFLMAPAGKLFRLLPRSCCFKQGFLLFQIHFGKELTQEENTRIMNKDTPSVLKTVLGDYFSFYCILILLIVASLSLYLFLTEESTSGELHNLLLVIWATALFPLILLIMRMRLIRYVFLCGEEVQGKIERIRTNSRRGLVVNSRVVFSYRFKGHKYKKSRLLLSDENLKTGQKVSIITDPDKPERAFIRSVFTD